MVQCPASRFAKNGPPGCASNTSSRPPRGRKRRIPALVLVATRKRWQDLREPCNPDPSSPPPGVRPGPGRCPHRVERRRGMPEITLPEVKLREVKLPEVKLPDGLRDMNRDDIVEAVREIKLPKTIKLPDVDLSEIELPDAIADRMPGRRRTNPLMPILALTVVGLAVVAAWWLFTSASTGPRMRRAVGDLKSRMNGEANELVRYDDETNLGSLIGQQEGMSMLSATDPTGTAESPYIDRVGVSTPA